MGNCNFKSESQEKTSVISLNNFQLHYVIGKGGFGKVWKIERKKNKTFYAMKEMSKAKIISKKSVNSVMNERQLLSSLKHPFIINMVYAFQDRENLYLVMDLMNGGDLRYHLGKKKKFNEQQTKFFVASIIIGLEYIHSNGVIHRDIKPENLVFDMRGYLRITDFGIARVWRPDNSTDTSGTPGYMAPEVMCRQNHGVAVDYYALGITAYECMLGRRPYNGKTRNEIRDQILSRQVQVKKSEIPEGWSFEAADFINKSQLIQRKPINRLGLDGPTEVKNHLWFKNFSWDQILKKEIEAPFLPSVFLIYQVYAFMISNKKSKEDNFDARLNNMTDDIKEDTAETQKQNSVLLRRNSVQNLFDGYIYDINTTATTAFNPSALQSIANSLLQPQLASTSNNSNQNNLNNASSHSIKSFISIREDEVKT